MSRRAFERGRLALCAVAAATGRKAIVFGMTVATTVVMTPAFAQACAVCTAGRDEENQLAFLLSTIGMSLMPLVAIGTLVFVLWRRIKKLEAEAAPAARRDDLAAGIRRA